MDIYSSLLTTLLVTVLATPALAVSYPMKAHHGPQIVQGAKANANSSNLLQKGIQANVNINMADAETLALELKGIGQKRAQAIIAFREKNGPFKSIDDLAKVRGISKRIVDQNRERITV
ncbi:MAG: ComEA family DNA-binding protein [Pseudomonadota bacterium]